MYILRGLLFTAIIISISCQTSTKMAKNEKKIRRQIEQVAQNEIGEKHTFSNSLSGDYILAKEEMIVPVYINLLVFENKTGELILKSIKEYHKAYWVNDILILEKKLGTIKDKAEIDMGGKENIIRHSFNPKTRTISISNSKKL